MGIVSMREMKLFFLLFQLLACTQLGRVLASYESMQEILLEIVANKSRATTGTARAFLGSEQLILRDIKRYGCWCYLSLPRLDNTPLNRGKSYPMDAIDEN